MLNVTTDVERSPVRLTQESIISRQARMTSCRAKRKSREVTLVQADGAKKIDWSPPRNKCCPQKNCLLQEEMEDAERQWFLTAVEPVRKPAPIATNSSTRARKVTRSRFELLSLQPAPTPVNLSECTNQTLVAYGKARAESMLPYIFCAAKGKQKASPSSVNSLGSIAIRTSSGGSQRASNGFLPTPCSQLCETPPCGQTAFEARAKLRLCNAPERALHFAKRARTASSATTRSYPYLNHIRTSSDLSIHGASCSSTNP